ncbi:hypothetical protein DUZ99_19610 [Xylanibacillus composti]|uniref:DUF4181 domain-containing protein n=1 Tax=Xylanibacillus composti TaxID=1572762 RepID=A0A8J4H3Q7_9BACL|nr:hypothetical protein [Xylanibacillus composti]MDT9727173.1 hypothetical protein [Xylanibacillus composti]GIQ70408.1 hypothetical protein XYCOK13_32320 [Xylanibacillus composti]
MLVIKMLALYNFAFGIFHLFFWKLLKWEEQLKKVSPVNRAVVQTLNLCLTFMFFLVGYCLYSYPAEIEQTDLGRALLLGIGLFWFIRSILQIYLFNMKERVHKILFVLFVFGAVIHISPFIGIGF